MSDTQNIFDESSITGQDNAGTTENKSEVTVSTPSVIKIDDTKSYKDINELVKAYKHANEHIKTIQQENAELKAIAEKAKSIDSVLEELKSRTPTSNTGYGTTDLIPDVDMLIDQKLSQREQETQRLKREQQLHDNAKSVATALRSQFGDKAEEIFNAKARELEMDVSTLHELAQTNPKSVLNLMSVATKETRSVSGTSHVRTESILNGNVGNSKIADLSKSYYSDPFTATAKFAELEKEFLKQYSDK